MEKIIYDGLVTIDNTQVTNELSKITYKDKVLNKV